MFCFECGPVATNCYLVGDEGSRTAFLIDAPHGAFEPVMRVLDEMSWTLTDLLLTHTHWDHTADCARLLRQTGARVVVHEADLYRLTDPMAHTIWPLPFVIDPVLDAVTIGNEITSLSVVSGNSTSEALCFGSCDACAGCTDPFSVEFDPYAGVDDGSCATALIWGCTYSDATNFLPTATKDDGSCQFDAVNPCPADIDGNGVVATPDLLAFLAAFGTDCD